MLSPCTTSKKLFPLPINLAGNGMLSSIFCSDRIGTPAATLPITGSCTMLMSSASNIGSLVSLLTESTIASARGLLGSFLMYPWSSSALISLYTVEVDLIPIASQISLTVGGNPFSFIVSFMYASTCC